MAVRFTDVEIAMLIEEHKSFPKSWRMPVNFLDKRGHKTRDLNITGESGNEFRLILRQNMVNPLDFSIILALRIPQSNQIFRLRRYNGKSHQHRNRIENEIFYDFHIHMATERYQDRGFREDTFAEATDRYGDFNGALECLLEDTGFPPEPPDPQLPLWER